MKSANRIRYKRKVNDQNLNQKKNPFFESVIVSDAFFNPLVKNPPQIFHDTESEKIADAYSANAVTIGRHIYFNKNRFDPKSEQGQKRMIHELAHVVQNTNNPSQAHIAKREISTPLPESATIDKKTKQATFTIDKIKVVVDPDSTLKKGTQTTWRGYAYKVNKTGALTVFKITPKIKPSFSGKGKKKKVTAIDFSATLYIKTFYGNKAKSSDTSAYGRGTTKDDQSGGNTSLGFHEGQHGQDFQDYVAANHLPKIVLDFPASIGDYNTAVKTFNSEFKDYVTAMNDYSTEHTDEVGTPMTP